MNHFTRLVYVVALSPLLSCGVSLADDESAPILLERLKAKDKAFDNAILRYTKWGEYEIDFPWWKYPPRSPEEKALMDRGPQRIKFRFDEQMVVRGPDTTFTRELDPGVKQDGGWTTIPYQKWGETGGIVREISDSKIAGSYSRIMRIQKQDFPVGIVMGQRRDVEFAHGFGFGTRIKTIESVVRKGNTRVVNGLIQLWTEDVSTFRLELGDDFLVKKAVIDCNAEGNLTRYEITTEGARDRNGFVFAETGHLKRVAMGMKNQKPAFEPRIRDEFSSRFQAVRFRLSDDEYKTQIKMEITPGTQVNDEIANKVYRIEYDGTVTDLGLARPKGR